MRVSNWSSAWLRRLLPLSPCQYDSSQLLQRWCTSCVMSVIGSIEPCSYSIAADREHPVSSQLSASPGVRRSVDGVMKLARHLMSYLRASSASRVLLLATRHAKHHAVSVRTDLYRHSSSIQRLLCLFRPGTAYAHTAGENRQVYIFITRFTTPTSIFLMLSGSTTLSSTQLKVAL